MASASAAEGWEIPLATVAKIWRAGCIIRSAFLDDLATMLASHTAATVLRVEPFVGLMKQCVPSLRRVVAEAALAGAPVPGLAAALSFFDMSRAPRSTADLIQAQRDYFGAHGFERTDREGRGFHGPWHRSA
jgi:6-phosphogluconate dehydrogenase